MRVYQYGQAVEKRELQDVQRSHIWQRLSHMAMPWSFKSLGRPIKKEGFERIYGQVYAHQGQYLVLVVIFCFSFSVLSWNPSTVCYINLGGFLIFLLSLFQFSIYVFCNPQTVKLFITSFFQFYLCLKKPTQYHQQLTW